MTLLVPAAVGFLLVLPAIYLVHLLRGSHARLRVPAAFLWSDLPPAPGGVRRRRLPPPGLLLALQLLAAAAGALALARPASLAAPPRHLAVVLDASASMQAADVPPSRFEAGRAHALGALAALAPTDTASVVRAGPTAELLASGPPEQAQAALRAAEPGSGRGALREGIALASRLVASTPRAAGQLLVVSDGASPSPEPVGALAAPAELVLVGGGPGNQAVVGLQVRSEPSGGRQEALVELANVDARAVRAPLHLFADDLLVGTRVVDLPPQGRVVQALPLPAETSRVTAQLAGRDALALDDVAEVVTLAGQPRQARLVSAAPSSSLRRALQAIPGLRLVVAPPGANPAVDAAAAPDLLVLEGALPQPLPAGPLLLVNPPAGRLGEPADGDAVPADGQTGPTDGQTGPTDGASGPTAADGPTADLGHPLLAGVDVAALRAETAATLRAPAWARVVLGTARGPLVLEGRRDGRPVIVFAFDPTRGGLDKSLAFPLLVSNAVALLASGGQGPAVSPGQLVRLPAPASGRAVLVRPDGHRQALDAEDGELRVAQTERIGRYAVLEADSGELLWTFSVSLVDAAESDIRPRRVDALLADARPAAPDARPSPLADAAADPPGTATEWWRPLAGAALALLGLEWLVFARRG